MRWNVSVFIIVGCDRKEIGKDRFVFLNPKMWVSVAHGYMLERALGLDRHHILLVMTVLYLAQNLHNVGI